jgi:hypothetical protein
VMPSGNRSSCYPDPILDDHRSAGPYSHQADVSETRGCRDGVPGSTAKEALMSQLRGTISSRVSKID